MDIRYARPSKILAETLSAVESYSRQVSAFCQERIRSIDVRNSRVVFAISDGMRVLDTSSSRVVKVLSETVLHLDKYVHGVTKFIAEFVRTSHRVIKMPFKTRSESINLSDVEVRMILRRILSDALTVGDSFSRTLLTMIDEVVCVVDKKYKTFSRTLIEHFHAADVIRSFKSLFRRHGSSVSSITKPKSGESSKSNDSKVDQVTSQKEIDDED